MASIEDFNKDLKGAWSLHSFLDLLCPADFTGSLAVWRTPGYLEEMMLSTLSTFLGTRIESLKLAQGFENYGKTLVRKEVIVGRKQLSQMQG